MKTSAIIRGGILGGLAAVVIVASAGQLLGIGIPPWSWTADAPDYIGVAVEWSRTVGILAPIGIVLGVVVAFACALAFEFVTRRAGWLAGAAIGLVLGVCGASIAGLIPWVASWYSYEYLPATLPLGAADVTWPLVVIVVAGIANGLVAGACYGTPVHAPVARTAIRCREIYVAERPGSRGRAHGVEDAARPQYGDFRAS